MGDVIFIESFKEKKECPDKFYEDFDSLFPEGKRFDDKNVNFIGDEDFDFCFQRGRGLTTKI